MDFPQLDRRLAEQAMSSEVRKKVPPPGYFRVNPVVIGDTPAELLPQSDPAVHIRWIGGNGVECETILVGTVPRLISRVLTRAGLPFESGGHAVVVSLAQLPLFGLTAYHAGDGDLHAQLVRVRDRLRRVLRRAWEQCAQVFR
jgi:hypothetical protein